jgi:hypothetical protein
MTPIAPARPAPPPPPPPPPPPGSSWASRAGEVAARVREAAAGTPGSMRLLGIGAIVVLLVFGALGALSANARASAIDDAREQSAQLVRLQTVRTNLVQADALATNAFLVGGLEGAQQRDDYESALRTAATTLADTAASSAPGDAGAFQTVNDAVVRYSGLIETARANNRQGFPVGVAYLKQASTVLRDEVLPALSQLSETTQSRVKHAYRDSRSATDLLAFGAAAAVLILLVTHAYLTVRTRRLLSIPLLVAAGVVVVATAIAGGVLSWAQVQADDVRDGEYRTTVALAQARIFAFDAKSAESLTLVSRGSGQAYEQSFQTLAQAARATLVSADVDATHVEAIDAYLAVHDDVRGLDDEGKWDDAVALATATDGGSNQAFAQFDGSTSAQLADAAAGISDDLDGARRPLPVVAVVMVLAGIAAAVAAWQGVSVRLREYR